MQLSLRIWRILLLTGLALLVFVSVYAAIRYRINFLFGIPLVAVLVLQVLYNYRPLFYLLVASIPCSLHYEVGTTLSTDMFSEPLMLLFLGIFIVEALAGRIFSRKDRLYPFHILVLLLLFWTLFTTLTGTHMMRSVKFLLAKIWYITAFVFIAEKVITDPATLKKVFWAFFIPFILIVIGILIRHAAVGFSFEESNGIAFPIFANGVIYAATLALFVPWTFYARTWYTPKSLEWYILLISTGILLIATLVTFKRGAWVAVSALPFAVIALNQKWLEKLVYVGLLIATLAVSYLVKDNNFYQFAPNYKQTIWHEGDIQGHLSATFSGTEISGMERFYRWVAAKNMIADRPIQGFGPSCFNQEYKKFADYAFRTYVSDNPEQSTTHNYFLMTFTEQGFVGGLLFLGLVVYMFIKATRLYYQIEDKQRKSMLLMALLSFTTIILHSLLNELIEVDKIGAMFWLNMLVIHKIEVWEEEELEVKSQKSRG